MKLNELLDKHYARPFHAIDESVFDADSNLVLDVRGWGRLSTIVSAATATAVQDTLAEYIADYLNSVHDEE